MKIQLKSDIHLEFKNFDITNDNGADILILAGDIFPTIRIKQHLYSNFLNTCSSLFKHVIYVAGNHEYYHSEINYSLNVLKNISSIYNNIHFLENDSIIIDGVKFVGCTLWTNFDNDCEHAHYVAKCGMSDYRVITNGNRLLYTTDTSEMFKKSLEYLKVECSNHDKVVVITHHAPSFRSLDPAYAGDSLNHAFITELDDFILQHASIKMWCHGHVHTAFDYMIGDTRIVCNPRGYHSVHYDEDTNWDENKTLEIL